MKKNKVFKIGILQLQGSKEEHQKSLQNLKKIKSYQNINIIPVKQENDLEDIKGLILPGGESTAIGKLLIKKNLHKKLIKKIKNNLAVWGTCAGAILLAKKGSDFSMKVLEIEIARNAFGRQIDSFCKKVNIKGIGLFEGVFIRAPRILKHSSKVEVLAFLDQEPIFVRQGNILASTFHPELTEDIRVHKFFVDLIREQVT